jgi:hypothetical protein
MKILRGLKQRSSIKNCAGELGSTLSGIQQTQTRLTTKMEMSNTPLTSLMRAEKRIHICKTSKYFKEK